MSRIHAGAQLESPPDAKYAAALRFAELALRGPLPKPTKLARDRLGLPESFACALVAPRNAIVSARGAMRFDEELERGLVWLLAAADAIEAKMIVLDTGADLTTGPRDRELLRAYLERIPRRSGRAIVWSPGGLWEPEDAIKEAASLDVVYGFDPLESSVPEGPLAYARLRALGARSRLNEDMLLDVVETVASSEVEEAYVAIASPRARREARRLQQIAEEEASDGPTEQDAFVPGTR